MLENNNQIAVQRLGIRSLKQNKTRNLFVILAVVLTTFMFTTVFSIGFSIAKNLSIMMIRQQGTKASIILEKPEARQVEQAGRAKNLNAAGIRIPAGVFTDEEEKAKFLLNYYDKTEFEENFLPAVSDLEGRYPEKEDEIMLSKAALEILHVKEPKEGMDIVLQSASGDGTYRLSGWYTDYAYSQKGYLCFVSKKCVDALGLTMEKDGRLCISANVGKQNRLLEELEEIVTLRDGQEFQASWDAQDQSTGNTFAIAAIIGVMGLIIVLSGYLLIYNVMHISVTKDIRFYGMLKTLGTSPAQIKKIVKMQVARLSCIGIPIGILLGLMISFLAVPFALQMLQTGAYAEVMPSEISFNPFIYVGTVLFAVLTVTVSCRKPAKLAGRVSAVEALRFNGQNQIKTKSKNSTSGGKVYKMAFRNVFREKKRAILVFASLFMGTMAFLSVDVFLGSMKLENYVEYYLPNDFTIYTRAGQEDNTEEDEAEYDSQIERLVQDLEEIDGITHLGKNRAADAFLEFDEEVFAPFLENEFSDGESMEEAVDFYKNAEEEERYSAPVISVDRKMIERYNERAQQKIDIERFEKGEICLIGDVQTEEQADALRGKDITMIDKGSGEKLSVEIGACMLLGKEYGVNIGYMWQQGGAPSVILISEAVMNKLCKDTWFDNIIVDCEADAEPSVAMQIKRLAKTNPSIFEVEIKSEMVSGLKSSMLTMNVLGGGISIILIMIGVLNFINVMLTGVYIRRGELAVMESVGMTKKQVKRMLTYEGGYYAAVTIGLILTLGNVIIYTIADMAQKIADYAVFHYPAPLMCIISVFIFAICISVPSCVYRTLSKESVTERLRQGE